MLTGVLALLLSALPGCGTDVRCTPGQLKYSGRPPRSLFGYDTHCRGDCFSNGGSDCDEDCGLVEVEAPAGSLVNDRVIYLVDAQSLGREPPVAQAGCAPNGTCGSGATCVEGTCRAACTESGPCEDPAFECLEVASAGEHLCMPARRALVYRFGFEDPTGSGAPAGWTFLDAGPRRYESALESPPESWGAELVMNVGVYWVHEVSDGDAGDGSGGELVLGAPVAPPLTVSAGSLEMKRTTFERFKGRFFLAFESAPGRPQAQVQGCFDLRVHDEDTLAAAPPSGRRLVP